MENIFISKSDIKRQIKGYIGLRNMATNNGEMETVSKLNKLIEDLNFELRKRTISVTELRIGNLVKLNDGDYHTLGEDVPLNDKNNIWKIKRIDEDGDISIYNEIDNLFEYVNIEDIEGIRLNDELLDKLKVTHNEYFEKGRGVYWFTRHTPHTPIVHLHQLQNIFFALKTYELIVSYLIES